jgi:predicted transcriptional regulator YheO
MKEFINKVFANQQITIEELSKFIINYSELCGIKNTTPEQLQIASQLIQNGIFDIQYACKNCADKLELQVVELWDTKTNQLIYRKIQEENVENN